MRVVIGEDSLLLRTLIARLLDDAGFDVVGQAGDGDELLRKVRGHRPDVVLIDVRLPLQAARTIRAELPEIGVLLLSQHADSAYARSLLEHGTAGVGYLLEDRIAELDRLTDAIREVARGGSVLDAEVVAAMLERRRRNDPLDALTPREHAVLAGMADGESNRGIARRLFVSESAVERHVTSIFAKLSLRTSENAHRRVLAVLTYLRNGDRAVSL